MAESETVVLPYGYSRGVGSQFANIFGSYNGLHNIEITVGQISQESFTIALRHSKVHGARDSVFDYQESYTTLVGRKNRMKYDRALTVLSADENGVTVRFDLKWLGA